MTGFVNLDAAYDIGTLTDWYISSVSDDSPVWTDEHIEELFNDFYVIPKDTPAADVAPVVHGEWIPISDGAWAECSECGETCDVSDNGGMTAFELFCDCYKYCPTCGAKMDGGKSDE